MLLSANTPTAVLDIFEKECVKKSQSQGRAIFLEELCMLLYFYMRQLKELVDVEEAQNLVQRDYRLNVLCDMLFARYNHTTTNDGGGDDSGAVEFSY